MRESALFFGVHMTININRWTSLIGMSGSATPLTQRSEQFHRGPATRYPTVRRAPNVPMVAGLQFFRH